MPQYQTFQAPSLKQAKADALRELGISITFIGEKQIEKKLWKKYRFVKEKWYEITVARYKSSDDKKVKNVYSLAANFVPFTSEAVAERPKKVDRRKTTGNRSETTDKKKTSGMSKISQMKSNAVNNEAVTPTRKNPFNNSDKTTVGMAKVDPNKYTAMLQRKHSELMAGHYSTDFNRKLDRQPLTRLTVEARKEESHTWQPPDVRYGGYSKEKSATLESNRSQSYRNFETPSETLFQPSTAGGSVSQNTMAKKPQSKRQYDQRGIAKNAISGNEKGGGESIERLLFKKNIAPALAAETTKLTLIKSVSTFSDLQHLVETLCGSLATTRLFKKDSGGLLQKRFIFFSGSVGVGKTTSLFKVASFLRQLGGVGLSVASFDQQRLMAPMQLEQFCKILAVPYRRLTNEEDLLRLEDECGSSQTVLIDLGGIAVGKNTASEIGKLRGKLSSHSHMIYFVDATRKLEDMVYGFKKAQALQADSLALCKLDETQNIGDVISFAASAKLPVSSLFYGTDIPHDYCQATQKTITEKIIKNWQKNIV